MESKFDDKKQVAHGEQVVCRAPRGQHVGTLSREVQGCGGGRRDARPRIQLGIWEVPSADRQDLKPQAQMTSWERRAGTGEPRRKFWRPPPL